MSNNFARLDVSFSFGVDFLLDGFGALWYLFLLAWWLSLCWFVTYWELEYSGVLIRVRVIYGVK